MVRFNKHRDRLVLAKSRLSPYNESYRTM